MQVSYIRMILICCLVLLSRTLEAQCELQLDGQGPPAGNFGFSVDMWQSRAIVGAQFDDDLATNAGSAFLFWSNDEYQQKIIASDGAAQDFFGCSVSIWEDVAIVGARSAGANGAAYIYRFDGNKWVEEQKLVPADGFLSEFGLSVVIYNDVAIIGDPGNTQLGVNDGAVFVYRYDGSVWNFEQKLLPFGGSFPFRFGSQVEISNDTLVVGGGFQFSNGAAFVFVYDGTNWVSQQLLSIGVGGFSGGHDVGISGDVIVVGDDHNVTQGQASGSAFVYRRTGSIWTLEQQLLGSDINPDDRFGHSVAIDNDLIAVGAYQHDHIANNDGATYVFRYDGANWVEEHELLASDATSSDSFGKSVKISGSRVIVGAYLIGFSNTSYVFKFECHACPVSGLTCMLLRPDQVELTWQNTVNYDAISVYRNSTLVTTLVGSETSWIDFGLPLGTYEYEIVGQCAGGSSPSVSCLAQLGTLFVRGDANADGTQDLGDAVTLLSFLFSNGGAPCEQALDSNDDETIDIADAIYALNAFFGNGPGFSAPVVCGVDPTVGSLRCDRFVSCP